MRNNISLKAMLLHEGPDLNEFLRHCEFSKSEMLFWGKNVFIDFVIYYEE